MICLCCLYFCASEHLSICASILNLCTAGLQTFLRRESRRLFHCPRVPLNSGSHFFLLQKGFKERFYSLIHRKTNRTALFLKGINYVIISRMFFRKHYYPLEKELFSISKNTLYRIIPAKSKANAGNISYRYINCSCFYISTFYKVKVFQAKGRERCKSSKYPDKDKHT